MIFIGPTFTQRWGLPWSHLLVFLRSAYCSVLVHQDTKDPRYKNRGQRAIFQQER